MIPNGLRARLAPLRPQPPIGGDVMYLGNVEIAIILGLIVIVIFLGSVLWRLHSAMDIISKGRRYY